MMRNGKNWRIVWGEDEDKVDYLPGDHFVDPQAAVQAARELRDLWFISCKAERTTAEEDDKLPKRDEKKLRKMTKKSKKFA